MSIFENWEVNSEFWKKWVVYLSFSLNRISLENPKNFTPFFINLPFSTILLSSIVYTQRATSLQSPHWCFLISAFRVLSFTSYSFLSNKTSMLNCFTLLQSKIPAPINQTRKVRGNHWLGLIDTYKPSFIYRYTPYATLC